MSNKPEQEKNVHKKLLFYIILKRSFVGNVGHISSEKHA